MVEDSRIYFITIFFFGFTPSSRSARGVERRINTLHVVVNTKQIGIIYRIGLGYGVQTGRV